MLTYIIYLTIDGVVLQITLNNVKGYNYLKMGKQLISKPNNIW